MNWKQYGKNFYAQLPEDFPVALVAGYYTRGGYGANVYCGQKLVYSQYCEDENQAKKLLENWLKQLADKILYILNPHY